MTTASPNQSKTGAKSKSLIKRTTKKEQLIRMLSGKAGSDVAALSRKLGWQSHTTRAALSGLRKAGYEIAAEKSNAGKPTRYRITAAPDPADSKLKPKVSAHAG
ncbi:MAG: DUF3489 domain-containing protein [Pseudomonadota bacterium]|uniref:DUF3489 domain-containing protein n=1 Tax=Roseovarius salincola TaxID=2978479 RepID=UPI0022A855CD|nr:DUF3489 domain-containing protein [Roseovarius sp. EGI FJ00037]MCZ0814024.1 DUF3489 domain-containing protein [Roseovarius sp. EGI FJ00037]